MTENRWVRYGVITALLVALIGGVYVLWPGRGGHKIVGYFTSAVGLYPGDDVRILGVPVGSIKSIEPRPDAVKITMQVKDDVKVPADARAVIMSPNIVAARFIQLSPTYKGGPAMADGGTIGLDRTAVPVEWDDVKAELTKISTQLGPQADEMQGPLGAFVNQAADTFDGNGDSFRKALRELSQTAGRLGDSRTDLFGTVKNLSILIDALSKSNDQIVQFSGHLASVSQVLADSSTNLDTTLGTLDQALSDIRGFLHDNNDALIGQVNKLSDFTTLLSKQSDDIEQILHVVPNALANFYNIYDPAQGSAAGLVGLPEFANPVQFICGIFDAAGTLDNYKRTEICRERMAPVFRRLAANYPPFMSHPINTITAYKGQVIYDTPATEAKAKTYIPYLQWIPSPGRTPPRAGEGTDPAQLLLPPVPAPGPPPPAQPYTLGPVVPPPGPQPPAGAPPPGPVVAAPGDYPAEGVPPMQPVSPQQPGAGG
ncbi:MAG TPA: virulence factor Mce family protein [Mycobacterium sp.]|jgi:phospholipid/cholesterol/gamma-HCH transport system substrate-binding protein